MSYYDYKIVPAPKKAKKVRGVSGAADLFALTLTDAVNELARQGWEYYCSESLAIQTPGGWFSRARTEEHTVLVFRKPREHLSPRLASETGEGHHAAEVATPRFPDSFRPERSLARAGSEGPTDAPFRPTLGPADQD
jgi:hypothetical protein